LPKQAYTEGDLRELVLDYLAEIGFTVDERGQVHASNPVDKSALKLLHSPSQRIEIEANQKWVKVALPNYYRYFANGYDIDPTRIRPQLVEVTKRWQHDLFRLARLTWSLPYSQGYGRRIRFLILDRSNSKLIGILALQSPPLSFPPRDKMFDYPPDRKTELVNQMMDIQTLGAVPPYNRLLGGKLVAFAAASNEVRAIYRRKYKGRPTEMDNRILPPHLVALTTTSAFGRSSIYNRLNYEGKPIAYSIGYTEGYGSFHLMGLYEDFRDFLEERGVSTRGGFGTGPRPKWQIITRTLDRIGLPRRLMKHGVEREAFLFPLVENLADYLEGRAKKPIYRDLPFADLANYWRERWLLPRSSRVDGWHSWEAEELKQIWFLEKRTEE